MVTGVQFPMGGTGYSPYCRFLSYDGTMEKWSGGPYGSAVVFNGRKW